MTRLDLINKLQEAETKKILFEKQLKAIRSCYFKKGELLLFIETKDYNDKGHCEKIGFDKNLMIDYLENEIVKLDELIEEIIKELK